MITEHARLLAKEVISTAAKRYGNGMGRYQDRLDFDQVLDERFPVRGGGGVAMANARTVREIREAIREYYAPDDHSREPTWQS
jgi:predicted NBD/HSP70 family sugar kinase